MAASSDSKKDSKVFDVGKPGDAKPDATTRPLIVSNRTILKDPTLAVQKATEAAVMHSSKPPVQMAGTAPTIQPLETKEDTKKSDDDKVKSDAKVSKVKEEVPEETKIVVSTSKTIEPPVEPKQDKVEVKIPESTPEPEKNDESEKQKEDSIETKEEDTGDGVVNAVAEQANAKNVKQKEEEEAAAKQEALEKLVTDKTYYVPVGQVTKKRSQRRGILLIFILLILGILVIGDLLIDAGIIKTSIKPPISIFHSN